MRRFAVLAGLMLLGCSRTTQELGLFHKVDHNLLEIETWVGNVHRAGRLQLGFPSYAELVSYRCQPATACRELERRDDSVIVQLLVRDVSVTAHAVSPDGDEVEETWRIVATAPEISLAPFDREIYPNAGVRVCKRGEPSWTTPSWSAPYKDVAESAVSLTAARAGQIVVGVEDSPSCMLYPPGAGALQVTPIWAGAPILEKVATFTPRADPSFVGAVLWEESGSSASYLPCASRECVTFSGRLDRAVDLPASSVHLEADNGEELTLLSPAYDTEWVYMRSGSGPLSVTATLVGTSWSARATNTDDDVANDFVDTDAQE